MLRPLALDLLALVLPIAAGTAAFAMGRSLQLWPRPLRWLALTFAVGTVAIAGVGLAAAPSALMSPVLSAVGGTVLLCWIALFLLGVAWSAPNRSFSSPFLGCIVALAGCLLLIEGAGPVWWRFLAPGLWQRTTDSHGCLRQSSGLTCAPAAAVMLLHQYGVSASEGEIAYFANTSLFGTDAWSTARALTHRVRELGLHAEARVTDYEACLGAGRPFVAHVRRRDVGRHAVLVAHMSAQAVDVIDPLNGAPAKVPRAKFEEEWDGTVVWLVGD